MIVGSALFVWHIFILASNCETPIVVVLSGIFLVILGSMEPAYYRGDILFVSNYDKPVKTGDVIVFKMEGEPIPIVHRALITQ
jgi:signal peptidase